MRKSFQEYYDERQLAESIHRAATLMEHLGITSPERFLQAYCAEAAYLEERGLLEDVQPGAPTAPTAPDTTAGAQPGGQGQQPGFFGRVGQFISNMAKGRYMSHLSDARAATAATGSYSRATFALHNLSAYLGTAQAEQFKVMVDNMIKQLEEPKTAEAIKAALVPHNGPSPQQPAQGAQPAAPGTAPASTAGAAPANPAATA